MGWRSRTGPPRGVVGLGIALGLALSLALGPAHSLALGLALGPAYSLALGLALRLALHSMQKRLADDYGADTARMKGKGCHTLYGTLKDTSETSCLGACEGLRCLHACCQAFSSLPNSLQPLTHAPKHPCTHLFPCVSPVHRAAKHRERHGQRGAAAWRRLQCTAGVR